MKNVLLLEDEPLVTGLLTEIMDMAGLETTVVTTVADARAALADQSRTFDLVIADKNVHDSANGFVILDELRESGSKAIRMAISASQIDCKTADFAYHKNGDIKAFLALIAQAKTLHQTQAAA